MIIKYLLMMFLCSVTVYGQNHFTSFLNRVNSAPDSIKAAIVDSFFQFARTQGIPFIEGDTANFMYRGNVSSISVAGDFTGWNPNAGMIKVSGTLFYYYSRTFEMNARQDYKFVTNGSNWILDPENPHQVSGGFGPNSELAMPEYVQPWEINYNANIPHGTVLDKNIYSTNVNDLYLLKVYLPPGYDSTKSYPAVYFQDGFEYISLGSAVNVLDNLIDSGKIEPVIAVFVRPNDRNTEYAGTLRNQYREFFVNELVPFIDNNFSTIQDPHSRLVLGDSYGGNISALISYNHPDVFGNCGLHSGALQPNGYEAYNLIINGPVKDIKFSSIWGTYEGLFINMRNLRDTLLARGYELDWLELPEGHSWGLWRANIDKILEYIYPGSSTSVNEEVQQPEQFVLYQNYPNPFNPATSISFEINKDEFISLKIYDILGREIKTLINEFMQSGKHTTSFNASELTSGVYFYRLENKTTSKTLSMMLIK